MKMRHWTENSPPPWGHQVKASLYFEGEPTDGAVQDFLEALNNAAPNAHFIGVAIEPVQDEPRDQG